MYEPMFSMSFGNAAAILATMFVLSIIPGPSILLVTVRSMTSSLGQGLMTIGGIVFANVIFILLVVYGVGALVVSMDGLFATIKYAGSAYLFWLGIKLFRAKVKNAELEQVAESSWHSNFTAGFIITISAPDLSDEEVVNAAEGVDYSLAVVCPPVSTGFWPPSHPRSD